MTDFISSSLLKADYDVGDLDAGVVNVVLHVDFVAGGAQQPHERVAQNGVTQMADVRSLVGVDAGVLDEGVRRALEFAATQVNLRRRHHEHDSGTIEPRVDVACAGDFEARETVNGAESGHDLLSDNFRSLAQRAGELQGDGRGNLAEAQVGRRLKRDVFDLE